MCDSPPACSHTIEAINHEDVGHIIVCTRWLTFWNSEKTQFIWLGSCQQLQKVSVESIDLAGSTLTFQSSVNNRSWSADRQPTYNEGTRATSMPNVFYQLRQLCVIRSSLSMKTCTALVHAFVTSRLDYCNSLLSGINKELLNRLECHEKTKIRSDFRRYPEHSTLAPGSPKNRIQIRHPRLQMSSRRCPSYLTELLSKVAVNPALQAYRSATRGDLVVPQTRTVKMGPRSFCVSGPMLWNSLPLEIRYHEQTLD